MVSYLDKMNSTLAKIVLWNHHADVQVSLTFINPENKIGKYWTEGIAKDVSFYKTPMFTPKKVFSLYFM